MKALLRKKVDAFSLNDLLVTLLIIGILVALAMPNLLPLITKAKATEAKVQLEHVQTLEKNYFYEHSKYSKDLTEIGYIQEPLTTANGRANYQIAITNASNTGFTATATSVVDFNGNGAFNVWQIDQDKNLKEVTPD
jgi:type IV pilus assembly protein PilE